LLTAAEHEGRDEALEQVEALVAAHVDWAGLEAAAERAGPLEPAATERTRPPRVRLGVLRDRAFSFYYPENLEALAAAGAELVYTSALDDEQPPEVDGLYIGGGFPEVHAEALSANRSFRETLAARIEQGLPVWAECGGLMYLARELRQGRKRHPMVGCLPVDVEQTARPQGHGYVQARVDGENPFLQAGAEICGHEFHYSRIEPEQPGLDTCLELMRGVGLGAGRDGLRRGSAVATYTHIHALGEPDWAPALVRAAAGED
jgi:cobyrinic acid a,c-diamide synthase